MKNIFKIIRLAKPLYGTMALAAVLVLVVSILGLATPLFSKFIVDEITAKLSGTGGNLNRLWMLVAGLFVVNVLMVLVASISERIGDHLGGRLRQFLTERFYHKVLTLPQSYYDSQISGKIVNQLNRGIMTINNFVQMATNFILPNFLQVFLTIGLMLFFNVWIGLATAALFPIYYWISHYSSMQWGKEEAKKNKLEDIVRGRISEVIGNIKLVKGFTTEKQEFAFISKLLTKINRIYARQSRTFHLYDAARSLSLQIIIAIVYAVAFYNTFTGQLSVGEMVLLIQLINMARAPLFAMSFILERTQEAEQGSREYFEVMALESKEFFDQEYTCEREEHPTIEFKNVTFKYEESEEVLKGINFTLYPNESIALVGHSGAGKSTIINLLMKFYEPTGGQIILNGKSYAELPHQYIRHQIALVFQENELFSTTIKENVAYGQKEYTDEQVVRALKLANAYDFVSKMKHGIDTEIGERGVRLSGGQKQRIQIARAIMKDAPILILDEATSSLDAKSELAVQKGLEALMKDRMTLIIAHRFSTIQNVHKIIVLDKGTIVDVGSPQELAERPGIYSDLLKYQVEGKKKLLAQYEIY
ncbi:MAG: ABC transporter ATP-binding protein/permease [Patescibacteria group bacterium]|nr:ABC transporter ATP-binding protein/permease [Patescibacteria group bacterium]